MASVRGVMVLNLMRFVRETFGPEAHERVLEALPSSRSATFRGPVREASWEPIEDLAAYMEAAKALLAPQDPDFYRAIGRFSGRVSRDQGGFAPMVAEPATSTRMAPIVWRTLYDTGHIEVLAKGPTEVACRVHGFPASRALCERLCGSCEGMFGTEAVPARAEETACVLDGSPFCEIRIAWD